MVSNFVRLLFIWVSINFCHSMSLSDERNDIKLRISSINGNCYENKDCWIGTDDNRVCVDHKCQCKPNYMFDYINNQCKYFTCRLDKDCQSYDQNRRCDAYDGCKCVDGFAQLSQSMKCQHNRGIDSPCNEDLDCWTSEDKHRVCHQNTCVCKLFYKYDSYSKQCLPKNVCDSDKDCHMFDINRVCDEYGLCVCEPGYFSNSIGDKCRKVTKIFRPHIRPEWRRN